MSSKKLALARETIRVLATKTHLKAGAVHLAHFDSKRWIGNSVIECPDTTKPPKTAPVTAK